MGLSIYFLDNNGEDVEQQVCLNITHNMNKVADIIHRLPTLLEDLINNEVELRQYLPSNGWGTFEGLISFVCDYLKECYKHKEAYIYCCR